MPDPRDRHAWHTAMHPEEAARGLVQVYADLAGEEALFRALLAERDLKHEQARFWVGVYGKVDGFRHP